MSFDTRDALRHSKLGIAHHHVTAPLTSGTAIFFRFINTSTKFSRACEEIPLNKTGLRSGPSPEQSLPLAVH